MAEYRSGRPSHSCPFWQPSCSFRQSAPNGPKRLGTAPTHKATGRFCSPQDRGELRSAACELWLAFLFVLISDAIA